MATLADLAVGNAVPGGLSPITGLDPDFGDRILRLYQSMPPEIQRKFNIISAFRSPARQLQVNPGVTNSRHSHGIAVDTTRDPDVVDYINQYGRQFGVRYAINHLPGEINHLEKVDPETGMRLPIPGVAPVRSPYAATGDTQFKSGLPSASIPETPPAPVAAPAAEAKADNAQLLSALALQNAGGGGGLASMLGSFGSVPVPERAPIVPDYQRQQIAGGPLPLSRRLS